MSPQTGSTGQQAGGYTQPQFAADVGMSELFVSDCGIYTAETDDGLRVAIPRRDAAGGVLCTEYRTSLTRGFLDNYDGCPVPYGLGLLNMAVARGYCLLVPRVEDVLAALLNGSPAIALGDVKWWPDEWTTWLSSIPELLAVVVAEEHSKLLRGLAASPLGDRAFVLDCRDHSERVFDRHLIDPGMVGVYLEVCYEDARPLRNFPFWRLCGDWSAP